MKTPFDLLAESGVRLLIIGGHALQAHGYARLTIDFDAAIAAADERTLLRFLESADWHEVFRTPAFGKYLPRGADGPVLDVMFVDAATFQKLWDQSVKFEWGPHCLRVPALPHVIAMKLHAIRNNPERELKDLADIFELLRANPGQVSGEDLQKLCDKYGTPALYSRLSSLPE